MNSRELARAHAPLASPLAPNSGPHQTPQQKFDPETLIMAEPKTPEPIITYMPDGTVEIRVGELIGYVTSDHLKEPKLHQLQQAWLRKHHD